MLTQDRLKELLSYDPETGIFINVVQRARSIKIGSAAGWDDNEYIRIEIDNKTYRAHRLAWLYIYGNFPKKGIDHINGNKADNRLINLREASDLQNGQNQHNPTKRNTSGYLGVSWSKRENKFVAQIRVNGKGRQIGFFNTAEEAHEAYLKAKKQDHPFWIPINKLLEIE
jgi:hypothetical protein